MGNYLVTGSRNNEPHVTSMDDASFNAGIVGNGVYILDTGEKLRAELETSNSIKIYDGDFVVQGRHARIERGDFIGVFIDNGEVGMKRNDLIVARYEKDVDTGVERIDFFTIKGEASASDPVDPEYTEGDIFAGDTLVEFPIYRVTIDGIAPNTPELLAKFVPSASDSYSLGRGIEIPDGADLNDYIEPGAYFCSSSTHAATLLNCPLSTSNFKLIVERVGAESYIRQNIVAGGSTARNFSRVKTSDWNTWGESYNSNQYTAQTEIEYEKYIKFPDGTLVQWSYFNEFVSYDNTTEVTKKISFPVSFANNQYGFTAMAQDRKFDEDDRISMYFLDQANGSIKVKMCRPTAGKLCRILWIAVGTWK